MGVKLSIEGGLAEIVLDRPDKMNALNDAMIAELNSCLERAEAAGVRAMLLRGEGPAFSAGRDLADADEGNEDAEAIIEAQFNPLVKRVAGFPAPTFASVHGACLGAGLGLALACDVVYIADDAKIGSPFARIGAVLDSGGHSFFVSRLGAHRALELIYIGRLISGTEAASLGLVNQSMPREAVLEHTRKIAAQVAQGPTAAFMQSKRIVRRIDEEALGLLAVLKLEAQAQGAAGRTADYKEGFGAFKAKRTPKFQGK
ncbi:MAG: enoyl-CoA hydratase-related protein [Candidatus Binatus sp.]|uniref:enoyl-CoA hydratase/isomerase family protein n=1 Tax=Candidatus Binatus sp. TaxID=2811406 RepID=UPI002726E1EC|nr:enoyl-CoA hydratase-related protein [Candidatus Binatus sp.]MDO8433150.1 enoyl-CoA hydratase-related protein [Candidatus Binatus sp.]